MSNYFREVREYLQDNPEHYWFKAKLYGWGWTPARWEGWAVIGVFLVLTILLSMSIEGNNPPKEILWSFFAKLGALIVALIWICYKKGEKPRWQWGPPKKKM